LGAVETTFGLGAQADRKGEDGAPRHLIYAKTAPRRGEDGAPRHLIFLRGCDPQAALRARLGPKINLQFRGAVCAPFSHCN
jgi:hypothetical protein